MPIPWTREGSSFGFGSGGSWLPQPAGWGALSVEAQTGAEGSSLELYRAAIAARRAHPGLGAGSSVDWQDAPEGVLVFARPGFLCTVNTTGSPVRIPVRGSLLLASGPGTVTFTDTDSSGADGVHEAELPADTTVWWTV